LCEQNTGSPLVRGFADRAVGPVGREVSYFAEQSAEIIRTEETRSRAAVVPVVAREAVSVDVVPVGVALVDVVPVVAVEPIVCPALAASTVPVTSMR